jgi:hypothetical protein
LNHRINCELRRVLGTAIRSTCPLAEWTPGANAASYIKKLPKSEHETPKWRLAIQMLIDAAENRGPMLFAKLGMLRAMERNVKATQRRVRKLARDR